MVFTCVSKYSLNNLTKNEAYMMSFLNLKFSFLHIQFIFISYAMLCYA